MSSALLSPYRLRSCLLEPTGERLQGRAANGTLYGLEGAALGRGETSLFLWWLSAPRLDSPGVTGTASGYLCMGEAVPTL